MEIPEDEIGALMHAGADALRFNAPLSIQRAESLIGRLEDLGVSAVVDLGCGRGELVRMMAAALSTTTVVGVDTDADLVRTAQELTEGQPFEERIRFDVGDATTWAWDRPPTSTDAAVCVGASHAFGSCRAMFERLSVLVPYGSVIVGDSIWQAPPNGWCRETFGELPDGAEALVSEATNAGWTVLEAECSTTAEWDEFEGGWIGGVRSVGTTAAAAFADQREQEYRQHYRGVLGFCWLVLDRLPPT